MKPFTSEARVQLGEQAEAREARDLPVPMVKAATSAVRHIIWESAIRAQNLALIWAACVCALLLIGIGVPWIGVAALGLGTVTYGGLVVRDSLDTRFLCQIFELPDGKEDGASAKPQSEEVGALELKAMDPGLKRTYLAVMKQRGELASLLRAASPKLRSMFPGGREVGESLVEHARSLVRRGMRLRRYMQGTKTEDLRFLANGAEARGMMTDDKLAAKTFMLVARSRQQQIETHKEVEGLYERALAQLLLIEATFARAIAVIVKINATDDEGSPRMGTVVSAALDGLIGDLSIVEQSLHEVETELPRGLLLHS
jgi:hypothetical protein